MLSIARIDFVSLDNSFRCKKKKRRNRAIILPTFDCYDIRGREQGAMPIQLTVVGILVGDSLLLRERVEQNNPFPYSRDSFLQKPTTDGCGMMDSKANWKRMMILSFHYSSLKLWPKYIAEWCIDERIENTSSLLLLLLSIFCHHVSPILHTFPGESLPVDTTKEDFSTCARIGFEIGPIKVAIAIATDEFSVGKLGWIECT